MSDNVFQLPEAVMVTIQRSDGTNLFSADVLQLEDMLATAQRGMSEQDVKDWKWVDGFQFLLNEKFGCDLSYTQALSIAVRQRELVEDAKKNLRGCLTSSTPTVQSSKSRLEQPVS